MSDALSREPVFHTVEARAHGWRIDHYLSRLYPNYSRGLFQRAIGAGDVLVNGLNVKPARRLRVNDRLSVRLPEEPDSTLQPEDIPLEILYEDEALAVINKPPDMIVHPGKSNYTGTLAAAVQHHFDRLSDAAGKLRPGIVHRLDRDTSGVIIIAKDNQVHGRLSAQFETRSVRKEYRAIVHGCPQFDEDWIHTHVRKHPKVREKMMVCEAEGNAREAITQYRVLRRFHRHAELGLFPKTGRTHQLRVHLRHIGHPILADSLYGGGSSLSHADIAGESATGGSDNSPLISRQALHAFRLTVRHPVNDQEMTFEAPLPADMQRTLQALGSTAAEQETEST